MDPYVFEFKGISLRWYTLLILIGVLVGFRLVNKEGRRFNVNKDFLFNLCFWVIIFGIIGARLYYVVFNFSIYKNDPISILKIWEGGLAIHGALLMGFITLVFYCKKYKMPIIRITDFCVPALLFAQGIGRWGNFFNNEAHGAATSLAHLQSLPIPKFVIEGMNVSGIYYEPTFYYESILCLIGFLVIMVIRRFKYIKIGTLTSLYLMYYGIIRFFIESMRTDSLMLGGFKVAQIVSVIMFILGLANLMVISRKTKFEDLYNDLDKTNIRF
ncbi:MAG: prolipoprotein diacylglyceryl transferase [Bacilli bacterium]|nr:prolipoprotein diacylglyceryl transferase [Bacilli bacterium]